MTCKSLYTARGRPSATLAPKVALDKRRERVLVIEVIVVSDDAGAMVDDPCGLVALKAVAEAPDVLRSLMRAYVSDQTIAACTKGRPATFPTPPPDAASVDACDTISKRLHR